MYLKHGKETRLKELHENCEIVEQIDYEKAFTATEIMEHKDTLADQMVTLSNMEDEFEQVKTGFRDRISPVKEKVARVTSHLKHGTRIVMEPCFKFIDREKVMVGYYNEDGVLVRERPATHDELQFTIKHEGIEAVEEG